MLTKPPNYKKFTDVVVFPTITKIQDFTYDDYVCTREDYKMAPRICSPGNNGRYHLRLLSKQQRAQPSVDTATVSNKIEFLRCMGLGLTNSHEESTCILCHRVNCICEMQSPVQQNIVYQEDIISIPLKPCSVLITGEKCKLCKRLFKCESDVRDHMKKEHKRKLKVVFKLHNQTVSTKWIKKRHLKRPRSNSLNVTVGDSTEPLLNDVELENRLHSSDLEIMEIDGRPCSAPSLGVAYELPFCQGQHCQCCIKNLRPSDDNNNNHCHKPHSLDIQSEFTDVSILQNQATSPSEKRLIQSKSISSQTQDWIDESIAVLDLSTTSNRVEADVIVLDDKNSQILDDEVVEVAKQPPCYDLTEDENFHTNENFHEDDEVQKILEIRSNRMNPFSAPKIEDDNHGLRISDAIRDLMIAENSLSNHTDDDVREPMDNNNDDDDDDDDFTLRFDDSEESCTIIVKDCVVNNKEHSKIYSDNSLEDTYSEMAIDHYDALERSSCFWNTTLKTVERFSQSTAMFDTTMNIQSSPAVKEELMIDHYMWS